MSFTRNFIVGQLAATRFAEYAARIQAGEEMDLDSIVSAIGRIIAIDGDNVTLKGANGDVGTFPASILVDVVHYDVTKEMGGNVGESATVYAIDHPLLPANEVVRTSTVKYILSDGKFETRNTLYMPNIVRMYGMPILSPYLSGDA